MRSGAGAFRFIHGFVAVFMLGSSHLVIAADPAADLPVDLPTDLHEQRISIALPDGRELSGQLRIPRLAKGERVPAVLLFGGFQNAGRVLDLVKPDRRVIQASFDYPFTPPRKFIFPDSLKYAPDAKRMIHDTVQGIRALSELLSRHSGVAPGKITAIGASLGAPFCIAAAARNPNIHGVVLVHGFGEIPKTIAHQFERAWRPKLHPSWNWIAGPLATLVGFGAWSYVAITSPEQSAAELLPEQHVLLISAMNDSFVPSDARESLWQAITHSAAQSERILMPGEHLQPGSDQLISELMQKVWQWSDRVGLSSASK